MAYHVHRLARLGPPMLISGNWYKAWDSLNEADRKSLVSAAQEARYFMRNIFDRWTRLSIAQAEEQGVNIVHRLDVDPFRRAFAPLIETLERGPAAHWAKDIRALQ